MKLINIEVPKYKLSLFLRSDITILLVLELFAMTMYCGVIKVKQS